ncbi:hypothetical protein Chor_011669, partial [Crotalus horridus]
LLRLVGATGAWERDGILLCDPVSAGDPPVGGLLRSRFSSPLLGSVRHSLQYQYVVVSDPSDGLPQFFTVGYLDGQVITYYDSVKKKKVPKASWMEEVEKEDANYWKDGSKILRATQRVLQEDLRNVQNRYKQKEGFHTWQVTYGCGFTGNGSKDGYSQYGYDGRTFLTFDKETLSWVASEPQAQITKRNWDVNVPWSRRNKVYLEKECIDWLEKYLSYRREEMLLGAEPPVVTMSSKMEADDSMETHVCRIHGFYPREIDASWTRDGEVWLEDTFRGSVAPNADGTYHYWLSIRIDPKDRGRYRCHVEHDGLQEPLEMTLKGERLQGGKGWALWQAGECWERNLTPVVFRCDHT